MKRIIVVLAVTFLLVPLLSQMSFNKYANNPIINPGEDYWESWRVTDPFVIFEDNIYKMWYAGCNYLSDTWQIGYATSNDGINWERYENNPVLTLGEEGNIDDRSVRYPIVLKFNDIYHLWFESRGSDAGYAISHATSDDGIHWTKDAENPVMTRDESYEKERIIPNSVLYDGDEYRLYYFAQENLASNLASNCVAFSSDGINWQRSAGNPMDMPGKTDLNAFNTNVIFKDGLYHIYSPYFVPDDDFSLYMYFFLSYANSTDGINWEKSSEVDIHQAPRFAWDFVVFPWEHNGSSPMNCYSPHRVINDNGKYEMWYGCHFGIGYASEDLPVYEEPASPGEFERGEVKCDVVSGTSDSMVVKYRIFMPDNYNQDLSYPVVICMHGSGNFGTDNNQQLFLWYILALSSAEYQAEHPAIIVAPQTNKPEERYDMYNFLDELKTRVNIDTTRIYLLGWSHGGFRISYYLNEYPDLFAGAVLYSGAEYENNSPNLIPQWFFTSLEDKNVSVSIVRRVIDQYMDDGIDFEITNSYYRQKDRMSKIEQQKMINRAANFVYTEYNNSDHFDVQAISFHESLVFDWLYSKRKEVSESVQLLSPAYGDILSGMSTISWSSEYTEDSIDIWVSPDDGMNWELVCEKEPNKGSFEWNTTLIRDCAFGKLKILLRDSLDLVIGENLSSSFVINNTGNSPPSVKLLNDEFIKKTEFDLDEAVITLTALIGDPENDPLNLGIFYSADFGDTYSLVSTINVSSGNSTKEFQLDLGALEFSRQGKIKVTVSDEEFSTSDSTLHFTNSNLVGKQNNFEQDFHSLNDGDDIGQIRTGSWFDDKSLEYTIYSGNTVGAFGIDPISDKILLTEKSKVQKSRYVLKISASCNDCGGEIIDTTTVVIDLLGVGVDNPATQRSVKIYPNPATDLLTVETDQPNNHLIEIVSLTGQLIYRTEMEGSSKQIDMTPFSKGIYFNTVRSDAWVRTEKVVKY